MLSDSARRGVGIAAILILIAAIATSIATGHRTLVDVSGAILGIATVALIIRMAKAKA